MKLRLRTSYRKKVGLFVQQGYFQLIVGKSRYWILTAILFITLLSIAFLPHLSFNYNMESFFDQKDPDVVLYETFKETFENENNGLIIGLTNYRGIFNHAFLKRVEKATNALQDIPEVSEAISPSTLKEYIYAPLVRSIKIPLLHIDEPTKYESDEAKIYASHDYSRSFFSDDKTSVALLLRFDDNIGKSQSKVLLNKLKHILESFAFDDYRIAGRLQTQQYYISEMQKEMLLFSGLALFLFITTLYMIFRYWKLVFIALGVVTLAQIWLFGLIGLLGISIDLMMVLLPSMIFILGTSISIHTLTHFQNEFSFTKDKISAIKKAISETGVPNFLNSFTTSVGFISLVFIPVLPLQRFGIFAALGIIITYIVGMLLIPIALSLLKVMPTRRLLKRKNNVFSPREVILSLLSSKKFGVLSLFVVMIIGGLYFSSRVQINNFFLDDLNASSSLKKDLMFFEQQFSGIKPIEILVNPKKAHSSILDYKNIIEMDRAETFLTSNFKTGFIISPITYIKTINKAMFGGDSKMYRLPESEQQMNRVLKIANKLHVWNRQIPILAKDAELARISFRTTDAGSIENFKLEEKLTEFIQNDISSLNFKITGVAHLLDNTNKNITKYLMKGILLAIITTTLVILIFTKSIKIALISIVTNVIPMIFAAGVMGFFSIPLKVSTSLIFTIIYGITVDDTIHFLSNYTRHVNAGNKIQLAINMAVQKLTNPMIFTSIVLFAGFMIFSLSDFTSIRMMGVLVGSSLLFGLITDLLLLPVLINLVNYKNQRKADSIT